MITIHTRNFSLVKDALDQQTMDIELDDDETVSRLLEKVRAMNKKKLQDLPIRVAVNQSYVDENYRLHNEDMVALIPPVSGG
ncbi:MAG TPA: MoaD/ThiS family protein [Candidatus Marinimicrobia bacterium]|jgi:molybdopterin converting factor small subunit|nr:MoaD/ThiS family protein [Candidatus Neomarinimicrobiota bacterium]MDP7027955.1 MoaD/ThiS family protein [Candidatus Neomarinimicrobiota bacterium]MDP7336376.1 MoaD/ThiS family protein [Candidatus Neomarinimicrobiota bacterium]MDP7474438.1 MoaD/ThiS family protein [Candidatus Neomarinimicrobiota bacterium]HJM83910.1 MoaD/ThiS family protein [Candidatus Neomarinimicrobiota bacterium]